MMPGDWAVFRGWSGCHLCPLFPLAPVFPSLVARAPGREMLREKVLAVGSGKSRDSCCPELVSEVGFAFRARNQGPRVSVLIPALVYLRSCYSVNFLSAKKKKKKNSNVIFLQAGRAAPPRLAFKVCVPGRFQQSACPLWSKNSSPIL